MSGKSQDDRLLKLGVPLVWRIEQDGSSMRCGEKGCGRPATWITRMFVAAEKRAVTACDDHIEGMGKVVAQWMDEDRWRHAAEPRLQPVGRPAMGEMIPDFDPRLGYTEPNMVRALRLILARWGGDDGAYLAVLDEMDGCEGCLLDVIAAMSWVATDHRPATDENFIAAELIRTLDRLKGGRP